jgi:hypothetical protein
MRRQPSTARLNRPTKIPQNKRTVHTLQSFYENTLYPEISCSFTKSKISKPTIAAHLHRWGFSIGRHSRDVYFDGHERHDVVQYRKAWASRMMSYRLQMKEFAGNDCDVVIDHTLQDGTKEIVLVTHDECYFNSNDDPAVTWKAHDESVIKKKGQRMGLMLSEFYCACHGLCALMSCAREISQNLGKGAMDIGIQTTWPSNL